jgi:competence protein ComEC
MLRIDGDFSVLLPGDVEAFAEQRRIREGSHLAAQVLVSPHHGSRSSSTDGFIRAVRPERVIHSAAWKSRFGHPHPEVLERYRDHRVPQWVTGWSGAIEIERREQDSKTEWVLREARRESRRWWRWPAPDQSSVGLGASP